MKEYQFNYQFSPIPKFMKKGKQVMIVLRNKKGNFILGAKNIYPKGIYRFVGGGVDDDTFEQAAIRELREELEIDVSANQLTPLAKCIVNVTDGSEKVYFETVLYLINLDRQKLQPSDDLDGIVELTKEEILQLAEQYKHLPTELIDLGGKNPGIFRWSDYGIFMSEVHKIAMELVE
jgi:8-oxo-dGTP pyrophosphatase MutT (NUDIX family)